MIPYRLTDKLEIRRHLNMDREWSLYALADLDDGMFEHCDWWALPRALALVFRAIAIRPIFVLGDAASTRELLAALPETSGYLNLQAHQLDAAEGIYQYRERHEMRRMFLETFQPRSGSTQPLTVEDCGDIERLYASGDGGGIAFAPFQLHTGFFRGIRCDGELVAVAGVQVASRNEGVAAVGNIFTRPDCRGRGLAQTVTSAVVAALREVGIETIGLNVEDTNAPAIRAYERIGFRTTFRYSEGIADRIRRLFDPHAYGDEIAGILALDGNGERLMPLAGGTCSSVEARRLLKASRLPPAVLSGLYLYFSCWDEAHRVAQDLDTPEGSYWHALVHRQEPDAGNSGYWFRQVGAHPIFPALRARAAEIGVEFGDNWNPLAFIDYCDAARKRPGSPEERKALEVQRAEWQLLFDWCAKAVI